MAIVLGLLIARLAPAPAWARGEHHRKKKSAPLSRHHKSTTHRISSNESKEFSVDGGIVVRVLSSDPSVAEAHISGLSEVRLDGHKPGWTIVTIWTKYNKKRHEVFVSPGRGSAPRSKSRRSAVVSEPPKERVVPGYAYHDAGFFRRKDLVQAKYLVKNPQPRHRAAPSALDWEAEPRLGAAADPAEVLKATNSTPSAAEPSGRQNVRQGLTQATAGNVTQPKPSPAPEPPPVPSAADKIAFQVSTFRFRGNTIFSNRELHDIAADYEHRTKTLPQLRQLCLKIRDAYKALGYVLARAGIPPQNVSGGHVLVSINEGKFGSVHVEGSKHYSADFLLKMFNPAMESGLVQQAAVERALLIINDLPDVGVRTLFDVGREPGTTDMTLQVTEGKQIQGIFEYNNFGNKFVGQNRASLGFTADNALLDGDQVSGKIIDPFPTDSSPYYQVGYQKTLDPDGHRLILNYVRSSSVVGDQLNILALNGLARVFTLNISSPLVRTTQSATNLTFGLANKSVDSFAFGDIPISNDRLREFTMAYDGNWQGKNNRTIASFVVTQGLAGIFGGTKNGAPSSSRAGAGAGDTFTKANLEAVDLERLNSRLLLVKRLSLQGTFEALTTPELMPLGGPDSVRGFNSAEFSGDYGFSATAELRDLVVDKKDFQLQDVVFVDTGAAALRNPLFGEIASRHMTGVGVGLRATVAKSTTIRLDLGHAVSGKVAGDPNNVLNAQVVSKF